MKVHAESKLNEIRSSIDLLQYLSLFVNCEERYNLGSSNDNTSPYYHHKQLVIHGFVEEMRRATQRQSISVVVSSQIPLSDRTDLL